jgi:hypothetical protein
MPNWCDTTIQVSLKPTSSKEEKAAAQKQFDEFVKKFQEANKDVKIDNHSFLSVFYPVPEELKITSGSATENGIAVLLSSKYNDHSQIDKMLDYKWVKDEGITDRDDLIIRLTTGKHKDCTNLKEGQQAIDNIVKYGVKDWYDWCVQNWGTKWDLSVSDIDISPSHLSICSSTAWSPCLEGVVKISEDYPLLHFRVDYSEPGMGFQGYAEIENGDCDDTCGDYDYSQDEEA